MATETTHDEVKQSLEEMHKAFSEFKKENDKKIDALSKQKSGAEFDEKLERINDTINSYEKNVRKFQKEQAEAEAKRLREIEEWKLVQEERDRKFEARINRAALGLGGLVDKDEEDTDGRLQRKAFAQMLRKGVERLGPDEIKVLTVSNDPTGGYLAPPTYEADIIKAEVLYSPMRQAVTVRNIGTGELIQPKRNTTAAASWQTETATRAETQNPAWGLLKIPAFELYAEARISWANLEDSAFDLEAILRDEFGEQFGVSEGAAVVKGTGVGQPQGFMDASANLAYTPSGSAATIAGASGAQADGLIALFHAVKTAYARNGTWVMNRASLGKVRALKDTAGQYLWAPVTGVAGSIPYASPGTILGAPYIEAPDMPDEGSNTYPIAFGDFRRAYTLVDRIGIYVVRDNLTLASSGQVKFFARRRVGGQVVLGEALRTLKCATS